MAISCQLVFVFLLSLTVSLSLAQMEYLKCVKDNPGVFQNLGPQDPPNTVPEEPPSGDPGKVPGPDDVPTPMDAPAGEPTGQGPDPDDIQNSASDPPVVNPEKIANPRPDSIPKVGPEDNQQPNPGDVVGPLTENGPTVDPNNLPNPDPRISQSRRFEGFPNSDTLKMIQDLIRRIRRPEIIKA